jgi:hypothetical protein
MATAPTTADPTAQPDPDRAGAGMGTAVGAPTRVGRLLGLLGVLIAYGKDLVVTLQQRAGQQRAGQQRAGIPDFAHFARPFGTFDVALIFARITCGLRRALLLEDRLSQIAARGRDLGTAPLRLSSPRKPRPAAQDAAQSAKPIYDPGLAALPTVEQIAAEVRRRPIGAVFVDICGDLGITPGDAGRLWDELSLAIMLHGGRLARFYRNMKERLDAATAQEESDRAVEAAQAAPRPPLPAFASTGLRAFVARMAAASQPSPDRVSTGPPEPLARAVAA